MRIVDAQLHHFFGHTHIKQAWHFNMFMYEE